MGDRQVINLDFVNQVIVDSAPGQLLFKNAVAVVSDNCNELGKFSMVIDFPGVRVTSSIGK